VSPHFRLVTPSTVVSSHLSLPTVLLCRTTTTSRFLRVSLASSPYWHEILSGGIKNRFGAASQTVIKRANVHLHDVANYMMLQNVAIPAHAVKSVVVLFRFYISFTYHLLVVFEARRLTAVHCVTTSMQVLGPIQRYIQCATGTNSSRLRRPERKANDLSSFSTVLRYVTVGKL
jgi:hypothetical protein